jgi:glyoxylate/hydroxypyruvate reductase A
VFPAEPLPADSPLWGHPDLTITPHNAAESDPQAITQNVLEQIARFERGEKLENVIDRRHGY